MRIFRLIIILLYMMKFGYCKLKKLIAHGIAAHIENFPYVAYLSLKRLEHGSKAYYMCGSSILNQNFLLTAAHCVCDFNRGSLRITMFVGHEIKRQGTASTAVGVAIPEEYEETTLLADIALVKSKTQFQFDSKVNRVAIMEKPPYNEMGLIAGWGLTDILNGTTSKHLLSTAQYYNIPNHKKCEVLMNHHLEKGSFCATSKDRSHLGRGDSGSSLVVRTYIAIGIASYRSNSPSKDNHNIAVYTDVGYYYKWIQNAAQELCFV